MKNTSSLKIDFDNTTSKIRITTSTITIVNLTKVMAKLDFLWDQRVAEIIDRSNSRFMATLPVPKKLKA